MLIALFISCRVGVHQCRGSIEAVMGGQQNGEDVGLRAGQCWTELEGQQVVVAPQFQEVGQGSSLDHFTLF